MTPFPRTIAVLALATLLGVCLAPRSAVAAAAPKIVITGSILDPAGAPLPDTWVMVAGSRRAGTLAGAGGRYALEVRGASMSDLARQPLMLRVQAKRKGWKTSLSGGAPELAVELSVVADSLGTRFRVRSNDAAVAEALANAAVLESGTCGDLVVDFVGVRGVQPEHVVEMEALQEVVLTGPARSSDESADGQAGAEAAMPQAPAVTSATSAFSIPADDAPAPSSVGSDSKATKKSAGKEKSSRKVIRPGATTGSDGSADAQRDEERPLVIRPGDPEAQAAELERRLKKKPRARPATQEEIRQALVILGESARGGARAASESAQAAPRAVARPAPMQSPESVLNPLVAALVPPATVTPDVNGGAAPAKPVPAPASVVVKPVSGASNPATAKTGASEAVPVQSVSPAPGASAAPSSKSVPTRAVAVVQPVAVAPSVSGGPPASAAPTNVSSCSCRVEGTVEVLSDQPLPERVQVFVQLDDDPRVMDTVELFMGSPRQFELFGLRCGPHTIKVTMRSKHKFVMTSAPIVDCSGGGYRQTRIVLEPTPKKLSAK